MAGKVKNLEPKIVEVKKEQSKKLEDQGEAVRRVEALAKAEGYSKVSLKQDLGDSWEFEYYP
mgnify:FL=1